MKRESRGGRLESVGRIVPLYLLVTALCAQAVFGQARVSLTGHLHPGAITGNDRGRVEASLRLRHVTVVLQPTAAQQADLEALLARQQDPASPDFHRWLTPEQYGERFGRAQTEIDQITSWLTDQNLAVDSVARGRNAVSFSGGVRDVEKAFQTEIHHYDVNGETHFANASEPSVPAALRGFVGAVHGLDDFRFRSAALKPSPLYNSPTTGLHYLAPEDVSTIFDIAPLYNTGVTGKGQKIVVVGQTRVNLTDIQQFRTYFNLSVNDPQMLLVPNTQDPGISKNDLPEADLDLEWAGAIARDASIIYVYSYNVTDAVNYAIDNNLAPVISMSYGLCEASTGNAQLASMRAYAQQANAQGITWIAASGDNGANDCYGSSSRTGLSVDAPASVPEVTGIGGTTLSEGSGNYWNSGNTANHASVISYIPETVWNDSLIDGTPSSSGGGASVFFDKPAWQAGPGVPADSARDIPDVSLPASANHDSYLVYSTGTLQAFGGTSVGTPVFAGMAGLLNQYLTANGLQATAGIGNMNPRLYALAQSTQGVFHDITLGDNLVDSCVAKSHNCVVTQVGYKAGPGYDQATGLGSVDAYNLVTAWSQAASVVKSTPTMTLTPSVTSLTPADTVALTAIVTGATTATPTGAIRFFLAGVSLGSGKLTGTGLTATATLTVKGTLLTPGTPAVTAIYDGDAAYAPASATVTLTVNSPTALVVQGMTSAASYKKSYAPGMIMALFGQNLAGSTPDLPASPLPTQLAGTTVTLNGIPAPLYYVSPGQINLQIPYEIASGATAIMKIISGGQTATSQITLGTAAPGIFADANGLLVPYQTTARGQTIVLFMTGDNLLTSPKVTTGSVPAAGTVTIPDNASLSVAVGGVSAAIAFKGVPSWSIGVTQINFTIPANAPAGLVPVVVTARGVSSAPVYISVPAA